LFDYQSQHQAETSKLSFALIVLVSSLLSPLISKNNFRTMSTVNKTPQEVLQRLFLATDAPLCQTWLTLAKQPISSDALHGLILDSKIPSVVKAQNMYGHFRTASQMNKVSGPYWKPEAELAAHLELETRRLNPPILFSASRPCTATLSGAFFW
jgi:hypothetical protein